MEFQTLKSEKIYTGRAFNVRCDDVMLPNGRTTSLDIIEHSGAVTILPSDDEGFIWFVRQYRHAAGCELLELPAGRLEDGEDPLECAHREIQEEIGMGARSYIKIGEFFLAPGYSTEFMHVYLAKNLFPSSLPKDVDEILDLERVPINLVLNKVETGKILDAKTIAALFLAQSHL